MPWYPCDFHIMSVQLSNIFRITMNKLTLWCVFCDGFEHNRFNFNHSSCAWVSSISLASTQWGMNKMVAILEITFLDIFWIKKIHVKHGGSSICTFSLRLNKVPFCTYTVMDPKLGHHWIHASWLGLSWSQLWMTHFLPMAEEGLIWCQKTLHM